MEKNIIKKLNECIDSNTSVALVTITANQGSSPRKSGSMMLVDSKGSLLEGTIGGGKIEETAKYDAKNCILSNESKGFSYKLTEDIDALGMACGGAVEVFVKTFLSSEKLIIVGAGHICEKIVYFAKALDYNITIIDHREEYANSERYPDVENIECGDVTEMLDKQVIDERTSVVIATHGHLFDKDALEAVLYRKSRYVGMIGSRAKIKSCFDNLLNSGVEKELLKKVYSPIGLNIGGETPEEIALAILAEIQSVKYGLDGRSMQKTKGQI